MLVSENASDCYHYMLRFVPLLESYFNGLLIVEQLIYCKENFLTYQNKTYQSIYQSILTTSQIGFDIALTNVEAKLKQRSDNAVSTLKQGSNDVVQSSLNVVSNLDTDVVSTLCKVENPTSDFASVSTSDQRYIIVDSQR